MASTREAVRLFLDHFLHHVEARPDAVAAQSGSGNMSYRELEVASAGLADALVDRGVGADSLVPILVGRSLDLPVAILGVLRAGAAYVPTDRRWPEARLCQVLDQVAAPVAVVDAEHAGLLPPDRPALSVRAVGPVGAAATVTPSPDDAAYVMFTSGSTGAPKGIVIDHRALSSFLDWAREYFDLGPASRVIQFSRLTFDASVWEVFGTFGSGGTLVIVSEDVVESPPLLSQAIAEFEVTHCDIVPSVLAMLEPEGAARLGQCMSGGERILRELVDHWAGPERVFINGYGPAEATVVSIAARCEAGGSGLVPIGEPIEGVEAYLLNDDLAPVERGDVGEIFLAGSTLARGYLGMPRETAERFLPDPFAGDGGRMYRTGDLAKQLDDGQFVFVGRRDNQVKIAGQRVEPEEAEVAVRAVAGVGDCAVVAVEIEERTRLAAFFTGEVSAEVVRRESAAQLPAHVMPSSFHLLDRLPLGPTGKIDRAALLATASRDSEEPASTARDGDAASLFLGAVEDVLGSADRGTSFAAAGGDSLDAMRVLSRLPRDLARRLTVRGILRAGSLEEVGESLGRYAVGTSPLPVIEPRPLDRWPVSQAQLGMLLADELESGRPVHNVSVVLRLEGELDVEALGEAVRRLGHRQQALARRIEVDGPSGDILARLDPTWPVELVDVGRVAPDGATALLREHAQRPFSLDRELPSRFIHAQSASESHVLLVTMHHLAADGWSVSVLFEELAQDYADVLSGADSPGPPVITFGDYADWESRLIAEGSIRGDVEIWRERLDPYPRVLRIGDEQAAPDPTVASGTRRSVDFELGTETMRAVQALAAETRTSPFMVLLTAFSRLIGTRSALDRFLIGCPMTTRFDWRLEKVVGHFINLLPIPIDLGEEAPFKADLDRISEAAHESYQLRHVPLGQIVKETHLSPAERLRPLIQVAFQLDDSFRVPAFPGLTADLEEIPSDAVALDLECRLVQRAGGLAGRLNFDASIYSNTEAEALAADFQSTVGSLCGSELH